MVQRKTPKGGSRKDAQWRKLTGEFPNHRHLDEEVLYWLPIKLIEAIRTHATSVLIERDVAFERSLRKLPATGLYRRIPVFSEVLDGYLWGTDEFERAAVSDWDEQESSRQDNQIRDRVSSDRPHPGVMDRRTELRDQIEAKLRVRMRGYAGWLVTHPEYWCDVATIFRQFGKTVNRLGEFPPLTLRDARTFQRGLRALDLIDASSRLMIWRDRWSLSSGTMFWIPEPKRAGIGPGDRFNPGTIKPDGLAVFLPWPMLVDNWLTIKELMSITRRGPT